MDRTTDLPQHRRSTARLEGPGRGVARLLGIAAVLVLAIVSVGMLVQRVTAPAAPTVTLGATHTSTRFAYSIDYPSGWVLTEATADWPRPGPPVPDGPSVDRFAASADATTWVLVSSDLLGDGNVFGTRRAELDQLSAMSCNITGQRPIELDGAAGRIEDEFCLDRYYGIDVVIGNEERVYWLGWIAQVPPTDADRELFAKMLSSFRVGE